MDDKTELLNTVGADIPHHIPKSHQRDRLFEDANKNSDIWTKILRISGGNINIKKCFYYYIKPSMSYTNMSIKYETKQTAPGQIHIRDPASDQTIEIERMEPTVARRTLEAILAPSGSSKAQLRHTLETAQDYVGKIKHSKLNNKAKWTALTTILQPKLLYPVMSCQCNPKELEKIERAIVRAKCNALGLNEHFPRAIYYGPYHLGGLAIPSVPSQTLTTRINYFLYHSRLATKAGIKLDASYIFLQLETGLLSNFLEQPYATYGFLTTQTLIKQIWAEMEPFGLTLRHSKSSVWSPQPQGQNDFSLMDFALGKYSEYESNLLNRYRLYLQVISLYDILQYDLKAVHTDIKRGDRIHSRRSSIFWVNFQRPPKKAKKVWEHFITTYIEPSLLTLQLRWDTTAKPNYLNKYFISSSDNRLYFINDGTNSYHLLIGNTGRNGPSYYLTPTLLSPTCPLPENLQPVDVCTRSSHITILCTNNTNSHGPATPNGNQTQLLIIYERLPKSLKRLCGKISFPPDGKRALIAYLQTNEQNLSGVGDASLKDSQCGHAWILSTDEREHLGDPSMPITGYGAVDGHITDLSSSRGELQSQTAMTVIAKTLLQANEALNIPITLYGDNQGVQTKCSNPRMNKLHHHRRPDADLTIEYYDS